ncbi:putative RNA-dependent RNA polymerase 1 [Prunus yedoensis var. nudiflora]|uniref:Putative RNA-dependent RNA polymerase 1 n=1 Tax=Prunus yedoensis var. nudiflora TaxID=2094558 RepID=A0A314YV73_PRUYE|nr:putative RNA-dependent RNA polymerase 1 [Prunus yedoensis var. nudiflora]
MVPNSRIFEHCMELVQLHLGCQISEEQFSVLWARSDCLVKFGKEFKNINLLLSLDAVEYKLEISSESIRQIELYHPRGQLPNFLLIQLLGAPRIFKKLLKMAGFEKLISLLHAALGIFCCMFGASTYL